MVNFIKSLAEVKEHSINFVSLVHMFRNVGVKLYQLTLVLSLQFPCRSLAGDYVFYYFTRFISEADWSINCLAGICHLF